MININIERNQPVFIVMWIVILILGFSIPAIARPVIMGGLAVTLFSVGFQTMLKMVLAAWDNISMDKK